MKLQIEVELDNAAFEDEEELPRILSTLAERLPLPLALTKGEYSILDANGNWVGYVRIVAGPIER